MAKVKKEPENLEGARSTAENAAVALTAEERLKLASERFERADEGARARVERQIKNMEESASEAKRRESEMKKSRTAAEKQAKSVTERKLAEQRVGDDRDYLNGKQDIHEQSMDLQRAVRQVYIDASHYDEDMYVVDCTTAQGEMATPEEIFGRIMQVVKTKINL